MNDNTKFFAEDEETDDKATIETVVETAKDNKGKIVLGLALLSTVVGLAIKKKHNSAINIQNAKGLANLLSDVAYQKGRADAYKDFLGFQVATKYSQQ